MNQFEGTVFTYKEETRHSIELEKNGFKVMRHALNRGNPYFGAPIYNVNSLDKLINEVGGVNRLHEIEVFKGGNVRNNIFYWLATNSLLSELLGRNDFWVQIKKEYGDNGLYLCASKQFNEVWRKDIGMNNILQLASDFLNKSVHGINFCVGGSAYLFTAKENVAYIHGTYFESRNALRIAFLEYMIERTNT